MKQRGVTHVEVFLIAVIVFAAGVLLIDKFIIGPEKQTEVTTEDRMKLQVNALENKLKAMTGIEARFQKLEKGIVDLSEIVDHVQNVAETNEQKVGANFQDILKLRGRTEKLRIARDEIDASLKKLKDYEIPEIMTVKLEEFKKPLAVALNQTRAQRPVRVTWKKGRKGWHMVDKTVEYSRAEYLRKLKKQKVKTP